jgi:zinc/manganese transport system permease protein
MAVAVAETAQIVGVLISTALLIGPAATAIALVRDPLRAIAFAMSLAVAEVWIAIALAYASYGWTRGAASWPVSFFVAAIALFAYLAARAYRRARAGS